MDPQSPPSVTTPIRIEDRGDNLIAACFEAMASPCEVLLAASERGNAIAIGECAANEAWRVERKYSRYRGDSVVALINKSGSRGLVLDDETALLMDFAQHCFELSEGMFDITSGVLRSVWHFNRSDRLPQAEDVERLLPLIGFDKLRWQRPVLTLPTGMELDFGGFGKEYAVDRAYDLLAARYQHAFLINFGGDLRANHAPPHGVWRVGIERPDAHRAASTLRQLEHGALATSGDSQRFLMRDGVRYGHILNPRTGWPVMGAPRAVSVAASSCTEAGLLATMASLKGREAEAFLKESGARYWLER